MFLSSSCWRHVEILGHVMVTVTQRHVIVSTVMYSVTLQSHLKVIFIGEAIKREGHQKMETEGIVLIIIFAFKRTSYRIDGRRI